MRKDKDLAIKMRREGKSYLEIRTALKIPRATLSDWFSRENWSSEIKKRLTDAAQMASIVRMRELGRVRGIYLAKVYEEARQESLKEFEHLKYNPLFIAGTIVYWGEGDRVNKTQVRISNVDPNMIRLFVNYLEKICLVPSSRIRANVLIYPDLVPEKCIDYWSKQSGLTREHFTKCVTILGRHKVNRLSHGVCIICVSSTYLKAKVLKWLEVLPKELMSREYYASI